MAWLKGWILQLNSWVKPHALQTPGCVISNKVNGSPQRLENVTIPSCTVVERIRGPLRSPEPCWPLVRLQLCLTLCNTVECSLPGSSVHGTVQARILEWVAISYSRGSSRLTHGSPAALYWQADSLLLGTLPIPAGKGYVRHLRC